MNRPLRVATRGSRLALRQVEIVGELLGIPIEPVIVETRGDRLHDVPLREIGGQGAFANDVRAALAAGAADIAVHSAKDLPAADDPRFALFFVERADARDALVGTTLATLPQGGAVATGAPRRRAQLRALRPDIELAELRGNIDTRLRKAASFSAIVVGAAALDRLAIEPDAPVERLDATAFVPQVGQGALAVETRHDTATTRLIAAIEPDATRAAVTAERAFLRALGGNCDAPAGAHATIDGGGTIFISAVLADARGEIHRADLFADDAVAAGESAARLVVARARDADERTVVQ